MLVKLNGPQLLKRTLQNSLSNFLICWTFVILDYPASELTSYVWGIRYFWVLVGTETDQGSLLQEKWFPGFPWSRPRPMAWLTSIRCAFPGFESRAGGWLAMAGVPGASGSQGLGGCSVGSSTQCQQCGQCWRVVLYWSKTWGDVLAGITENLVL